MSDEKAEEDPIKLHREGTSLSDVGKHEEAADKFLRASELYRKIGNNFDASYTLFKAAECNYLLKDYSTAIKQFQEAAEIAFQIGYDRFGLSALEYELDCYKATGEERKGRKLEKKIKEVRERLSAQS